MSAKIKPSQRGRLRKLPKKEYGGVVDLSNINLSNSFSMQNNLSALTNTGIQPYSGTLPKGGGISAGGVSGIAGGVSALGGMAIDAFSKPDKIDEEGYIDLNEKAAAGKGALKGLATGASMGAVAGPIGAAIGAVGGAIIGGVSGLVGTNRKEARLNKETRLRNNKIRFANNVNLRLSNMTNNESYLPVARQGGFTVYKGETHEGPNGGILTDAQGNPTGLSNNKPIALTENKEVARFNPNDSSTYIYSHSLGFAEPAADLVRKYKLDKSNSQYKNDPLLKQAVDKQFDNLTQAQELLKEKKAERSLKYRNGGKLPQFHEGGAPGHTHIVQPQQLVSTYDIINSNKPSVPNLVDTSYPPDIELDSYGNPTFSLFRPEQFNAWKEWNKKMKASKSWKKTMDNGVWNPYANDNRQTYGPPVGLSDYRTTNSSTPKSTQLVPKIQNPESEGGPQIINKPITKAGGTPILTPRDNFVPTKIPNITADKYAYKKIGLQKPITQLPNVTPESQNDSLYNPTLSPLGHILSGAGQVADYFAMKKARPKEVNLQRVGAERISLATQRLANERNAGVARSMNTYNARNAGMNAGAAMANTAVANTGVNRLLGQQNAELMMQEENTNAQLRQQANMLNAELAAQEGLFNTQTQNAYRARLASINPAGNLARTAASYFADNAAYGQGYDTLRMLAPNAELYAPENDSFTNRLLGLSRLQVRLK